MSPSTILRQAQDKAHHERYMPGFPLPERVRDKLRKGGMGRYGALCPYYKHDAEIASSSFPYGKGSSQ